MIETLESPVQVPEFEVKTVTIIYVNMEFLPNTLTLPWDV